MPGSQATTIDDGSDAMSAVGERTSATTRAFAVPGSTGSSAVVISDSPLAWSTDAASHARSSSRSHVASGATRTLAASAHSRAPSSPPMRAAGAARTVTREWPSRQTVVVSATLAHHASAPRAFAIRRLPPVARSASSSSASATATMHSPAVDSTTPKGRSGSTPESTRKPLLFSADRAGVESSQLASGEVWCQPWPAIQSSSEASAHSPPASLQTAGAISVHARARAPPTCRASMRSSAMPPPGAPPRFTRPAAHAHQPAEPLPWTDIVPCSSLDDAAGRDRDEAARARRVDFELTSAR